MDRPLTVRFLDRGKGIGVGEITLNISANLGGAVSQTFPFNSLFV